jgi:hypothetical protein
MRCSNINKYKQPSANLKQVRVFYFQIKFGEDARFLPIVEHCNT